MKPRGFTLIELLVVISIIALLSSVVLASLNSAREKARVAALLSFATQVDRMASDHAVGIWDLDDCSGASAVDRSGYGNDGTLTNMDVPSDWISDAPTGRGCALSFDGTNDLVVVGDRSSLDVGTGSFTLSAWIRTSTAGAGNMIVAKKDNSAANAGYYLGFSDCSGQNRLCFVVQDSSGNWVRPHVAASSVANGLWRHVAAVADRDANRAALYVDGVIVATHGPLDAVGSASNGTSFNIGRWGAASRYWNGDIDGVRVFAKALTASEVGRLYAEGVKERDLAYED